MPESSDESVPKQMQPVFDAIVALTDQFCRQRLDDEYAQMYMSAADIGEGFGVGKTTASTKARDIRAAMKIKELDPKWTLPSRMDRHPYAWYVEFNGLIVDARTLPHHIQEEAFRKGLTPYVPEAKKG